MNLFVPALGAVVLGLAACAPVGDAPHPISPGENQCRASDYQYLIGRSRSEIPAEPAGATWRVTCTSCPVTMDYNPRRLNIFYDEGSGIVREVRCG